jgi:hypothetical protein
MHRKMKTTSLVPKGRSRRFTRYASLVAISVLASALICIQPILAQTDGGSAPEISIDHRGSPMASDPGEPWDVIPPSLADPTLAPEPTEQANPQLAPMRGGFMPESPGGLREPSRDPANPATSPMLTVPPHSMARPGGGFYAPVR